MRALLESPPDHGGRQRFHPATSPSHSPEMALILAFAIGGGVTLLVVFVVSVLFLYYRFKSSKTSPFDPATVPRLQKFSYRELKAATGSFSIENKLGQGGFGPVHKGVLRNGQVVAVKSLDSASLQGEKEFQNEMAVIGSIRCSHIVGLMGYCAERKKRLLVYEYMANRSLQEALFHDGYPVELDWKMRYKVILDIAQALAFLHFRCEPPIIHGDIKPSNVLLDDKLCARLADFGLARVKTEAAPDVRSEDVLLNGEAAQDHDRVKVERFVRDSEKWHHKKKMRKDALSKKKRLSAGSSVRGAPQHPVASGIDDKQQQSGGFEGVEERFKAHDQTVETSAGGMRVEEEEVGFSFHNESAAAAAAADNTPPPPSSPRVDGACWKVESRRSLGADRNEDGTSQVVSSPAAASDNINVGHRRERRKSTEWWWKQQDERDETNAIVKDYTVDWLSCQVKSGRSRSRDWGDASVGNSFQGKNSVRECSRSRIQAMRTFQLSIFGKCFPFKHGIRQRWKRKKKQHRSRDVSGNLTKSREWWREEYLEDLCNKSRELKGGKKMSSQSRSRDLSSCSFDFSGDLSSKYQHQPQGGGGGGREWWSGDLLHWIHRRGDSGTIDFSGELNSFSRELRSRERTLSRERWSGELGSRGAVSSTTSMRGTVCYAAPEYGGAGILSEKSDVYSFGVLVLVIVAGRRPLQVVSPSVEFERANLTSWARHLVHNGDVLELVDPSLRGEFSREQAALCIMVALQCIQRLPASRPSMAEVVRVVSGEAQLPPLELFSPSPQKIQEHHTVELPLLVP
ncbi:receptor-like serine/threonine-protein kinase At4g25390 [Selaginella moellendorffii]|uniref:receptor-like serine/threonine-protein kinase At4g25390 n=1 Tax=Selaginella moellendorffii TaxID=88036 RepID=UPI000D1CA1AB|nr:receptor-like serine/threonine-protein kinase At4g25390 [Selaginella moellendorffii]|eukprot:XP_024543302.1 receptor-like serine/threonine-protein kinase At4g25390 [Selaginella moellendorffii]